MACRKLLSYACYPNRDGIQEREFKASRLRPIVALTWKAGTGSLQETPDSSVRKQNVQICPTKRCLVASLSQAKNPMTYMAWRAKGASQGLTWLAKKCQVRPAPQTEMEFKRGNSKLRGCGQYWPSLGRKELEACRKQLVQAPAHKICRSVRQNDASQTWPFFGTGSEIVGQALTSHNLIVRATTRFNELAICLHMPRWTAYNLHFLGSNPC